MGGYERFLADYKIGVGNGRKSKNGIAFMTEKPRKVRITELLGKAMLS